MAADSTDGYPKTEDEIILEEHRISHEDVADMLDFSADEIQERIHAEGGLCLTNCEWVRIAKALLISDPSLYAELRESLEENHLISHDAMAEAFG